MSIEREMCAWIIGHAAWLVFNVIYISSLVDIGGDYGPLVVLGPMVTHAFIAVRDWHYRDKHDLWAGH